DGDGIIFLEKAIRFGAKYQENQNSSQVSLFGDASEVQIPEPVIPGCEAWGAMEKLRREKEVIGIYISGHPLDDFKTEIKYFCNAGVSFFSEMTSYVNKELSIAGVITDVQHRVSRNGKGWAVFTLEDYTDSFEFKIFGEEYLKFRHLLAVNAFLYAKIFIKEGWTNTETGERSEPRLQFNTLKLLQDVMDNYARKLTIQLDIHELEAAKIASLKTILKSHKGDHALNFVVYEREDNIKLHMPSRRKKVKISNELLVILKEQEINYKLN
ncbi:MAG: DNA polymerase III subunit alpha, partial [Sinomicrobium sp.]|nr:DNA polymerase III subunit alpha [Sinomicrobium sp.]